MNQLCSEKCESVGCPLMSDSLPSIDCSLPGSPVHEILLPRILEWAAFPFSRGSSWPTYWTCLAGRFFTTLACAHIYPLSWASLPSPYLTPLHHHKAPGWAPCDMQQLPASYFTHGNVCMSTLSFQFVPLYPLIYLCLWFKSDAIHNLSQRLNGSKERRNILIKCVSVGFFFFTVFIFICFG